MSWIVSKSRVALLISLIVAETSVQSHLLSPFRKIKSMKIYASVYDRKTLARFDTLFKALLLSIAFQSLLVSWIF